MALARSRSGELMLGGLSLATLARGGPAGTGTPAYVYDLDAIAAEAAALEAAFDGAPHLVAYAVKANSAGPILRTLLARGCGADVVSGAELSLAIACGFSPDDILFSGVAKAARELDAALAAGSAGIGAVQVESVEEIPRVAARARAVGRRARVSLRLNPAASLESLATHMHIATGHDDAKFGIPRGDFLEAVRLVAADEDLTLAGLSTHVGSQFTTTGAYVAAARSLFEIAGGLRATGQARSLAFVDTGGGFGVDYGDGCSARPADFVRETRALQVALGLGDLPLYVEPGRSLVAAHGVLVASVLQHKVTPHDAGDAVRHRWLMIDAGMNDLLRPALYQARHRVVPLQGEKAAGSAEAALVPWRVVGPVCESSDDFGEHRMPGAPPEAIALLDAGAYGYTMASRYNGRPLPAEVFVQDGRVVASRAREPDETWVVDRASL